MDLQIPDVSPIVVNSGFFGAKVIIVTQVVRATIAPKDTLNCEVQDASCDCLQGLQVI